MTIKKHFTSSVAQDCSNIGREMHRLMEELYPICRSITGNGVRETLRILQRIIPIDVHEVPSGTRAFDWIVPKEWNIRDAYIKDPQGKKIVDFRASNIHVVSYSTPVHKKISLQELKGHLHSLPDHPDWIPYRTTYYKENWGFCLSHRQLLELKDGMYEVSIDSTLKNGSLTYGELTLPGQSPDTVLLSCYVCHPSLCNDNLSGVTLLTFLGKALMQMDRRYTYRLLFIPETIGAVVWLSRNEPIVKYIKHGLVATCIGDAGMPTYQRSRQGNTVIDRAVEKVLTDTKQEHRIVDFVPSGSDERQFSSPGFNLPVGSLMRTMYDRFPEYHTSHDNMAFVRAESLGDSFRLYQDVINMLEQDIRYQNLCPKCEPQLGRRGLYTSIGGRTKTWYGDDAFQAMFWVLNFSDGEHSLLDIAVQSGIPFRVVKDVADTLREHQLLKPIKVA